MEASRYSHLAAWYDRLFPLDPQVVALVEDLLPGHGGQSILDAGCGTGLLAQALVRPGRWVGGFDLDPDLLLVARSRAVGSSPQFWSDDVRTFSCPLGTPPLSMVTCLGNTLAHLLETDELEAFFSRTRNALSPGGTLLVQVLDYDRLRRTQTLVLPDLQADGARLERRYNVVSEFRWRFETNLMGPWGQSKSEFELRPWGQGELVEAIHTAGLVVQNVWGGFDRRPAGDSLPLVIRAFCP